MGCGGSRLDHDGGPALPPQLPPHFLLHTKEPHLLFPDGKDEESGNPKEHVCKKNGHLKIDVFEDALSDTCDEDVNRRMIGHNEALGSPSFRVFFREDDEDNDGEGGEDDDRDFGEIKTKTNAFKCTVNSDNDTMSSKDCCDQKKKVKRGRKLKSFRKVLPKGGQAAVKNLLSMKSYNRSSPSSHHPTGKTTASVSHIQFV